ncbi:hypothetical protein REPUB_Repub04eG0217300 [Reevesia pubescens]
MQGGKLRSKLSDLQRILKSSRLSVSTSAPPRSPTSANSPASSSARRLLLTGLNLLLSPPVRRASANVVSIVAKYAVPAGEWPDLLPFLFQCSQSPQEDHREVALIIFSSLTETIGSTFRPHFAELQALFLKCLQDETSNRVRVAALKAVGLFLEFTNDGAEVVKFREFIPSILNVSRQCLAAGEEDVAIIAFEIFDELIESPAPLLRDSVKSIVRFSLEVSSSQNLESNTRHQNANPKFREASVTVLGVVSEGCAELIKDKLEPVLHIVLGALRDPEQMVRGAASFALGQFAEHLQPEIISHYASVLPCILNALEDVSDEVKEKSYYALAAFCADMGIEILPFLDPLMGKLLAALQNSSCNLQETCMSAIGSVAAAAEQAFIQYAERVLELMKVFMVLTNDEDLLARARATELVGIVAMSVGRTRIEPILPAFVEAAISGFGLEFSELREYTHGFFSNVAEIMDDGFVKYLPHVLPMAFSSCNLDDGSAVDIDESNDENINGFGEVSSDDEAHDEPRVRNISIRTGVLDEKAAATQALGLFAQHTKSSFAPYLEESLKILVRHSGYFHEDVWLQAIIALKHILTAAHAIFQCQNDGSMKAKEVLDTVMNIYIKTMTEDDDKEVVAQACMSIADIIKDYGYMALEPYMSQLVDATLLREESACQQLENGSDIDDDDDAEHDEILMDTVSDILPAFAKSMGSHFAPIFSTLFEPLMKFVRASRPPQDRTMVVACLAEVAQDMGAPIASYIDRLMPLVLKELALSSATNRRNAAFCAGELPKNGGESSLKDNAAGAVARMIMVHPQSIPLNQILSHVPELVNIFAQVLVSPTEASEVKAQVGRAFSHLISLYGQEMHPLLSNLPPAHANALAAFVQNSLYMIN